MLITLSHFYELFFFQLQKIQEEEEWRKIIMKVNWKERTMYLLSLHSLKIPHTLSLYYLSFGVLIKILNNITFKKNHFWKANRSFRSRQSYKHYLLGKEADSYATFDKISKKHLRNVRFVYLYSSSQPRTQQFCFIFIHMFDVIPSWLKHMLLTVLVFFCNVMTL